MRWIASLLLGVVNFCITHFLEHHPAGEALIVALVYVLFIRLVLWLLTEAGGGPGGGDDGVMPIVVSDIPIVMSDMPVW